MSYLLPKKGVWGVSYQLGGLSYKISAKEVRFTGLYFQTWGIGFPFLNPPLRF